MGCLIMSLKTLLDKYMRRSKFTEQKKTSESCDFSLTMFVGKTGIRLKWINLVGSASLFNWLIALERSS